MIFFKHFCIEIFFVKNVPFSSLKNVRVENEEGRYRTGRSATCVAIALASLRPSVPARTSLR